MGRSEIRGGQIRDDSITGDDVNESTLILPQTYHASGNHNSLSVVYIAIPGRNGWCTSFVKNQFQLVAPWDGIVTKVFLRPTIGDGNATCFFQVRTNGDGNEAKDGATNVVTTTDEATVGVDEGTTEIVLSTPAPIPKGHAFSFAIFKPSAGSYGITNATIVIEWDLST